MFSDILAGCVVVSFLLWLANEVYLLSHYGLNFVGLGGNVDEVVFKVIFFKFAIMRSSYVQWNNPPMGWRKVWWRIYRKVK